MIIYEEILKEFSSVSFEQAKKMLCGLDV